jgi:hypothetical protein
MDKVKDQYTMTQMGEKVKEVYEQIFSDRKEQLIKALPTPLEGEVIEIGNDETNTETKS